MVNLKAGTRPPWVGLGAAIWVQIAAGNAYNFPLYSHSLKSVLGFNQHQLTMLGVANDIGENVGIFAGWFCNKYPPWVLLMIGAFSCFLGYGVLWLALSRTILSMPYWLLCVVLCMSTNSSAWLSTAVLVTNMRNFPVSRGTVAGILKGYSGLSAAVFTEIFNTLLRKSSSRLLMFLSVGVPLLCFVTMFFVRACTPTLGEDNAEHGHFLFIQVASGVLGVYVLTTTILDHMLQFSAEVSYVILALMIVLLMAPLMIPIKMTIYPTRINRPGISEQPVASSNEILQGSGSADRTEPLLMSSESASYLGSFREDDEASEVAMLLAVGEGATTTTNRKRRPKRGENFSFCEAVVRADFWLLFFVYFVGVGTGVTVLNNLAQIGIALGVQNTTILLSLFSFCNFAGRLGGGIVSERFLRSKTVPRTMWMTCSQIIMLFTYLLFASAIDGTLYIATALLGICYGVQFSIMIPTVSELFGLQQFGTFYNFMSIGNPLGAFLFSGLLAGYVYDTEAAKQHGLGLVNSSISCIGPNCFRYTFVVLAGVCGAGSVASIILTERIRPVYQKLFAGGSFRVPQTSNH